MEEHWQHGKLLTGKDQRRGCVRVREVQHTFDLQREKAEKKRKEKQKKKKRKKKTEKKENKTKKENRKKRKEKKKEKKRKEEKKKKWPLPRDAATRKVAASRGSGHAIFRYSTELWPFGLLFLEKW